MARTSLYDLANTGDKVLLEGTLVYSAIKEKAKPSNPTPFDKDEAYRITIADPKVVKGGDSELGKNILRDDISHGSFESKSGKYAGHQEWSFTSKSKYPINIYSTKTKGDSVPAPELLTGELAPGQKVGVLFSIYEGTVKALGTQYKSGSLDGVVIEDPANIKYYGNGAGGGNGENYEDFLGAPTGGLAKYANKNADSEPAQTTSPASEDTSAKNADEEPSEDAEKTKAQIKKEADDLF